MSLKLGESKKAGIFYGWIVLAAALSIAAVAYSMRYGFALFYPEILGEFRWTRAETATAFSISLVVYGIGSPLVGALTDRWGPKRVLLFGAFLLAAGLLGMSRMNNLWVFYLLFGIVMATGINSLGFAVHSAYLASWFATRRGLVFGVLVTGAGLGNVLAGTYQALISGLSWRGAYVALAAITIGVIVPLVIFVIRAAPAAREPVPKDAGSLPKQRATAAGKDDTDPVVAARERATTEWTLARALKTHRFWFIFLMSLLYSVMLNLVLAHQPIYLRDMGFSALFAASIFGLSGLTMMIGSFLGGYASDRMGREVTYTLGTVAGIIAVGALILVSPVLQWLPHVYVLFWGLISGMEAPIQFSSAADLFPGRHFGAINGACMLGFGIGGAIGPWMGGYIFDTTRSYALAFLLAIAAMVLSCVSLWLAAPRRVRQVPVKMPRAVTG